MRFCFFSDIHFEKWSWRNSVEYGIGGSETSHVEMAWRLARRGHEVISYAPVPFDGWQEWRGTKWTHYENADFKQPGIWVIYRNPAVLDKFPNPHPGQTLWIMSQDTDYGPAYIPEREAKIDCVLALCHTHAMHLLRGHPGLEGKVWITSNGVKMDMVRELEANGAPVRNPKKLIYASSPDRGLKQLLQIFKRAREFVPDLELHAFYGFDNIDKLISYDAKFAGFKKLKYEIDELLKQPRVYFRGRVSQKELYQEWLTAGLWVYPTNFTETSCITCMEAQALGAIPITNPLWALAENVRHGVFIEGDAWNDPLVQSKYAAEIVRLATQPELQEQIRKEMMRDIRYRFNWERYVDQWEALVYGYENRFFANQYNFQLKHAKGRILNVGCDIDIADFKSQGAVNVDLLKESPIAKVPTKADVIADARNLPTDLYGRFDTVILGDILEHLSDQDAVLALQNAKKALENGGNIIVTCPNDSRPFSEQHEGDVRAYAADECSFHKPVPRERLEKWIKEAGLELRYYEPLDYSFAEGHGAIVR